MALNAFLDSNKQSFIPQTLPVNVAGELLEKNEEYFDSVLGMAQMNTNLAAQGAMNPAIMGNYPATRASAGHIPVANLILPNGEYMQIHGNNNVEPFMSFSTTNPVNGFSSDDKFSHLCQRERENEQLDIIRTRQDASTYLKKPRFDVNQESIHHDQQLQQEKIIQELLLKKLQSCNPQMKAMMNQYREQTQLQQPVSLSAPQLPKEQMRSFAPLFDGALCSRRLKQYLYHMRNNNHDNGIAYWNKFVSEYYAPGSKKRWCFSTYESIELHAGGVFCPKSVATWCCDICGSRSGKGLEATFDLFPRLFKMKLENGMLDEILFLDSPLASKISSGLVLEYRKAMQEGIYENFRVVHEGTLRIVFRHDLKILSWEFCMRHHEEFLLRRLVAPQVNKLVQAAAMYHNNIQNAASYRVLPEDLQMVNNLFVSAGNQLARNVELPLVNALGYPKRFIRCLQIADVVDSMKDLIAFSHHTRIGPIESLNKFSQASKTSNQMNERHQNELFVGTRHHANGYLMTEDTALSGSGKSGLAFANLNQQPSNSHLFEAQKYEYLEHGKNSHQVLADKLLHEMPTAKSGKSVRERGGKLNKEARNEPNYGDTPNAPRSAKRGKLNKEARNEPNYGDTSNAPRSANCNFSSASRTVTVKAEPYSPEQ